MSHEYAAEERLNSELAEARAEIARLNELLASYRLGTTNRGGECD